MLSDTAAIWTHALGQLGIQPCDFAAHSALLVIPDLYDHVYVRESVSILFRDTGFKQVAVIQVRADPTSAGLIRSGESLRALCGRCADGLRHRHWRQPDDDHLHRRGPHRARLAERSDSPGSS